VAARVLLMIGDGLFWNRALYPDFDPQTLVPVMMTMIETLINPVKVEAPAEPAPARKKAIKNSKAMALLAAMIGGAAAAGTATPCRPRRSAGHTAGGRPSDHGNPLRARRPSHEGKSARPPRPQRHGRPTRPP